MDGGTEHARAVGALLARIVIKAAIDLQLVPYQPHRNRVVTSMEFSNAA
jgi:hypothetical protein